MENEAPYESLRSNFESVLAELLRSRCEDEGLTLPNALNRVSAEWLGYELDDDAFPDGAGDRGVDFWFAHSAGFDVFQAKAHELLGGGTIDRGRFDSSGVRDLSRIREFLLQDTGSDVANEKLVKLKSKWDFEISGRRTGEQTEPLVVNLVLLVLGDGLTAQAQQEFDALSSALSSPDTLADVEVHFRPALYTLETLIDERWREQNREWRDRQGNRRSSVELRPYEGQWVGARQDVIFYCHAIDLVNAYENFGYQLFEPNVRAHIAKSRVNAAIEESVKRRGSRHEFRLLNNGVTVTCSGYTRPTDNRPSFRVREPGIVNGLQTVVALHSGYRQLSHSDKADFETSCLVLVRLLHRSAVADIGKVVLATNTQNQMQPRNLISNRSEQAYFEQLFAERGWFYERKQGAWDAFSADPARWRTLQNKRPQHFRASSGPGRPRYKRIDNEDLAQTWLSFVGFSKEAANLKRELFDEKWYEFIFLRRTLQHASSHDFNFEKASADSLSQAPDVNLMLLSWLARELARAAAPSAKRCRDSAIERLSLDPSSQTREELEVALSQDDEYTLAQVLRGSSLLFVELLGYVLYRSVKSPHSVGAAILSKGIPALLREEFSLDTAVEILSSDAFEANDTVAVIWKAFLYIIETLAYGPWGDSYRAAPVKVRFLLSPETRKRFTTEFDRLDEFLKKREVPRTWAAGIAKGQGLYGFVKISTQP